MEGRGRRPAQPPVWALPPLDCRLGPAECGVAPSDCVPDWVDDGDGVGDIVPRDAPLLELMPLDPT
jgi:hypothetical protein